MYVNELSVAGRIFFSAALCFSAHRVHVQLRFDAYESSHADFRKWLMDGSLDYLVPQLYWPIARTDVSFPCC